MISTLMPTRKIPARNILFALSYAETGYETQVKMDEAAEILIRSGAKSWVVACAAIATTTLLGDAYGAAVSDKSISYSYVDCDSNKSSFTLPYFQNDQSGAGGRINSYVHVLVLETAPPVRLGTEIRKLPASSWINSNARGLQASTFTTNENRVVNVALSFDSCSAHGGVGKNVYPFDARSGRLLVKNELLTAAGRQSLSASVFEARRATIQREIHRLTKQLASKKKQADVDRLRSSLAVYDKCLEDRFSAADVRNLPENSLGLMTIGDKEVVFSASECSSQIDAAFDEIGGLNNKIDAAQLRPFLTPYGRYIFFGEAAALPDPINKYAQFFQGKIDNAAVTLYLGGENPWSNEPVSKAVYFYDKYRTLIPLSVEKNGADFKLTETESREAIKATLDVKVQGSNLIGKWHGAGKTYPFTATAQ